MPFNIVRQARMHEKITYPSRLSGLHGSHQPVASPNHRSALFAYAKFPACSPDLFGVWLRIHLPPVEFPLIVLFPEYKFSCRLHSRLIKIGIYKNAGNNPQRKYRL